jgi:citrate lyase subunit beta / citryl-CoA lyase
VTLRLRRSELSTPGSSSRMLEKAAASAADLVFCDLEDSVAPAEKAGARSQVVTALRELDWGRKTRAVRINAVDTPWALEDVAEVVIGAGEALDVIIVPKVKAARDVWFVETLLDQLEPKTRRARPVGLEVLIEEVEGLIQVEEIARCSPRLEALIFGPGDMSASQGVRVEVIGTGAGGAYPGDLWHYARSRIVVAARAARIDAIDGPFANFRDPEGYRREAQWSSVLGFVGKWAVHPDQIPLANEVYSPTGDEVARARRVIDAYAEAEAAGTGAATHGGAMIDAATVRILRNVIERAELIGP